MAAIHLSPPEPFNFNKPDEWGRWKRRFDQYRVASGLSKEKDDRQVSTLLYCLGDQAEDVLASTGISEEEREGYKKVLDTLDKFFKVRKNVIFERARFNQRAQTDGETAEEYITALHNLVQDCEYGELKDEMLRDRLVVGIKDTALSQKLQLDSELTLEKAMKAVRQKEAVREQYQTLTGGDKELNQVRSESRNSLGPAKKGKACTRCGREAHPIEKCPAKTVTCYRCQKKGHFSAHCRTGTAAAVHSTQPRAESNTAFLGPLASSNESCWTTEIEMCNTPVTFKVDTGAEVTAISKETFKCLQNLPLQKPIKILSGPTGEHLAVKGQFTATLSYQGKTCMEPVYVVSNLKTNLLGLPAIRKLDLLGSLGGVTEYAMDIYNQFPKLFQGLGTLGGEYTIKLKNDAQPFALYTARHIPIPLQKQVKTELDRMEAMGVISKVTEPTQWCAGMVVVPKSNGTVRICVDLKPLNDNVLREIHPLPKVDETLAQLTGASVFSKLDANSGFWQVPLAKESRPLTTFITPYGRYWFNKLPFGISSAPEHFQRLMNTLLDGCDGVLCHMDDVLVYGSTQQEHDKRLKAVLQRVQTAGVTLNKDKCEFSKNTLKFLGHIISKDGVSADPDKTKAIQDMVPPKNITELRRFMGMVNQFNKFTPCLAEMSLPLRCLLSEKQCWTWGPDQEKAFLGIKGELAKTTTLVHYNLEAKIKISADASSHGVGAVLLQLEGKEWKPVAFASRAMTETEGRYAQIEKEALAITWACGKFEDYVLGKWFTIETDHKPLVPLLSSKQLNNLPPRILRFRLRLMRFDYSIEHVPGKLLYIADTLSRAVPDEPFDTSDVLQTEVEAFIDGVVKSFPATEQKLQEYIKAQDTDPVCIQVKKYCRFGWPEKHKVTGSLAVYWSSRGSLTLKNGLLLYGNRIVVPQTLQKDVIQRIHEGHLGVLRCKMRATDAVWWPGMSKQIEEQISRCHVCAKRQTQRKEPMIATELPEYPWQKIGSDMFEHNGSSYLLVVDYFSRFIEVVKMTTTTSNSVIMILKSIFSRHGIPETLRSDNGPQYVSTEFKAYAKTYGFKHITSSPRYPQSNGQAERAVQTVKRLLSQPGDPHLALLNYNATPLPWCSLSPAELLMGRCIRTTVPQITALLIPKWPYLPQFRERNAGFKQTQSKQYNKQYGTRLRGDIEDGAEVWVSEDTGKVQGRVVDAADTPRSHYVRTPTGQVRRNRSQLTVIPHQTEESIPSLPAEDQESTEADRQVETARSPIMTRSKTGAVMRPPDRLIDRLCERGDVTY
eukprot:Em0002g1025a